MKVTLATSEKVQAQTVNEVMIEADDGTKYMIKSLKGGIQLMSPSGALFLKKHDGRPDKIDIAGTK